MQSQNIVFLRIKFEMNQYLFKSTVFQSLTAPLIFKGSVCGCKTVKTNILSLKFLSQAG